MALAFSRPCPCLGGTLVQCRLPGEIQAHRLQWVWEPFLAQPLAPLPAPSPLLIRDGSGGLGRGLLARAGDTGSHQDGGVFPSAVLGWSGPPCHRKVCPAPCGLPGLEWGK